MFKLCLGCGLRFKRQAFYSECEVRVALARTTEREQFTANGKSRMKLPIDVSTVVRVVRGLNAEQSLSEIKTYLESCGWNVPVVDAEKSYHE
jgi:hypothetical protein